jgi:TolB-like protein/DNA-binding winged helix-turn-helix (wHTH) protein
MDLPVARTPDIRFGPFELNRRTGELRKHGVRVRLPEQSFQVLLALLENRGELVTRDSLRQRLWVQGTFVDFEHGLNLAVTRLRQALNDSAEKPLFVETVPRRGYRFIGSVTAELPNPSPEETMAPVGEALKPSRVASNGLEDAEPCNGYPYPLSTDTKRSDFFQGLRGAIIYLTVGVLLVTVITAVWLSHPASKSRPVDSIAVLPLTNLASSGTEDYLADGITEELITQLGKISSLRVISRTSVVRFKNTKLSLPEVGRSLNVNGIVEGTVQRAGDHVRITVQLIGTTPEHQIWSEGYDGDLTDVLNLQSQVAQNIAAKVLTKLALAPVVGTPQKKQIDIDTYEQYLQGRHFLANRDADGLNKALICFEQTLNRDPNYAEAHAGLALAYSLLAMFELRPAAQSFPRAKESADKAIQLDSSLSEAYTARAAAASFWDLDWIAADRDFRHAIALDSSSSIAHQWYGEHFINVADPERAVLELKRAREVDPLSLTVNSSLGRVYHDTRNYDRAVQQCRKALDLYPSFSVSHWCLGLAYLGKHQFSAAVEELERADELGTTPLIVRDLARAYVAVGRSGAARRMLRSLKLKKANTSVFVPAYLIAMICSALGEDDETFGWLQQAFLEKDPHIPFLASDPELDRLRLDSRFTALISTLPPTRFPIH